MRFDILTIFPDIFGSYFDHSIVKRAKEAGLIEISVTNIRDYAQDRHKTTDDYPYGGGSGMVMKPEPIAGAIRDLTDRKGKGRIILLTPGGNPFSQDDARRLSLQDHLILICGRYEGIDERVREIFVDEEISAGDYVLTGGEIPAMIVIDAVSRLIPGVLGSSESAVDESFATGLLEYPQYTRPPAFEGRQVPEVLLSGNHEAVRKWRRREALRKTAARRPEMLERAELTEEDRRFISEIEKETGNERP